ncbi:CPCC family cysteine-rich protein [Streptomyces sp. NPDC092307]|uniref:CPCC family cysteine-rich protein n=1 Tax=Streptomyces sp. NPDC092307 TaxID=3366013 RepID=UPI00381892D3
MAGRWRGLPGSRPDVGGPNHVTLREARENYAEIGASELRLIERVRGPRPEEIPSPQDEAPGRQSWLEFVDNPEVLLDVFGERAVPELDGIVVHEVRRYRDGPSFLIRFDLPAYPADPPDAWRRSGFTTVQVELALLGAESALEAQRYSHPAGSITLRVGPAMPVHLSLEAGRFRARANADRAVIHEVTAYTRSGRRESGALTTRPVQSRCTGLRLEARVQRALWL